MALKMTIDRTETKRTKSPCRYSTHRVEVRARVVTATATMNAQCACNSTTVSSKGLF
jgi:hypothetical protein